MLPATANRRPHNPCTWLPVADSQLFHVHTVDLSETVASISLAITSLSTALWRSDIRLAAFRRLLETYLF